MPAQSQPFFKYIVSSKGFATGAIPYKISVHSLTKSLHYMFKANNITSKTIIF